MSTNSGNKKIGILAAARRFGVDKSMVSRWMPNEEKFNNAVSKNRRVGAGRIAVYPVAEEELVNWIRELRLVGIANRRN
ncbi:1984_t:CDS:2 [Ambispora leptoticha]|uniref:1984_t:CDS:1 n=1 Tax=Ambispora leptoticha TaxID=144679 RepID=A0A9N9FIT6_9GLOM|nr:1984_t:CDS:2 [Ambispora leptoticha]